MPRTEQTTPTPETPRAPSIRPRLGSAIVFAADAPTRQSLTDALERDGFGVLDLKVADECFAVLPALAAPAAIVFALEADDHPLWARILQAAASSDHIFFAVVGDQRPMTDPDLPPNVVVVDAGGVGRPPASRIFRAVLH